MIWWLALLVLAVVATVGLVIHSYVVVGLAVIAVVVGVARRATAR